VGTAASGLSAGAASSNWGLGEAAWDVAAGVAGSAQVTPGELAGWVAPGLAAGVVAEVEGSLAALWAVAAAAQGPEDWCAIAALPQAGLLAAAEAGLVLSRAVVVPRLGARPLPVLAGLVDAYGLVVAGKLALGAADRRRIEARLRHTGGRLVTAGRWGGAAVSVKVGRARLPALGENQGRADQPRLDCQVRFKGSAGPAARW
jgi:hypothetical protein